MMKCNIPWEGQIRKEKQRLARFLLPTFLCTQIFNEREVSGYEAGDTLYQQTYKCILPILCSHIFCILNLYLGDTQTPVCVLVGVCEQRFHCIFRSQWTVYYRQQVFQLLFILCVCLSYILCLGGTFWKFFQWDVPLGPWNLQPIQDLVQVNLFTLYQNKLPSPLHILESLLSRSY